MEAGKHLVKTGCATAVDTSLQIARSAAEVDDFGDSTGADQVKTSISRSWKRNGQIGAASRAREGVAMWEQGTKSNRGIVVAVVFAVLVTACGVSIVIMRYSKAAFTGSTANSANNWATGSVLLSDDDSGTAMFSATNMTAGQSLVKCIAVTYSGSVTSGVNIRLYGTASGALASYLNLTVEQGTGGGFSSCTGFTGSPIYAGTVSGFAGTYTSFGAGLTGWSPTVTPDTRTYRVTVTVQNDNSAQSKTATADYTWEAQG